MRNKKVGIYALICPDTERIKYIGQSVDIRKRYLSHLRSDSMYPVSLWIKNLKKENKKPKLKIMLECDRVVLDKEEIKLISSVGIRGLYNISTGGSPGYDKLSTHKPWAIKGMSCPTKKYILFCRNSFGNLQFVKDVAKLVKGCRTDKERSILELRFAKAMEHTHMKKDIEKWLAKAVPKMMKSGYI